MKTPEDNTWQSNQALVEQGLRSVRTGRHKLLKNLIDQLSEFSPKGVRDTGT